MGSHAAGDAKINAGGCLLTVDVNLYYTTGRIYSGYFYLPAEGAPWFFVKRPNGLTGDHVEYTANRNKMAELFASHGLEMPEKLLLEADELTYNDYIRLQKIFNPKETGNATAMMRELRRIKTPYEIEMFRISAERHAKTYAEIPECFRPGMTDLEFQYEIEKRMRKNGSIGLFRAFGANMDIFMGSILAGENAEVPSPFDFALGGGGIDASLPVRCKRDDPERRDGRHGGYGGKLYGLYDGYDTCVLRRPTARTCLPGASDSPSYRKRDRKYRPAGNTLCRTL